MMEDILAGADTDLDPIFSTQGTNIKKINTMLLQCSERHKQTVFLTPVKIKTKPNSMLCKLAVSES